MFEGYSAAVFKPHLVVVPHISKYHFSSTVTDQIFFIELWSQGLNGSPGMEGEKGILGLPGPRVRCAINIKQF